VKVRIPSLPPRARALFDRYLDWVNVPIWKRGTARWRRGLPCLPSSGEHPPTASEWVHEIKHDGYRLIARRGPIGIRRGDEQAQGALVPDRRRDCGRR
jgi:hypothetical protein